MRLRIGSTLFAVNGTEITSRVEVARNTAGIPFKRKGVLDVKGWLDVTGGTAMTPQQMQTACTLQMNTLMTALATPYRDVVFLQDNGSPSATYLYNAQSIGGVVVTAGPNFPDGINGYTAVQRFEFTVEAEYYLPASSGINTASMLLSFTETLSFSGGGPRVVYKESIVGPAQRQVTCEQTIYKVTQSGSAVGILHRPDPLAISPPKWPANLLENPAIDDVTPQRMGLNHYEGYGVSWRYSFGSSTPLIGVPTLWTGN